MRVGAVVVLLAALVACTGRGGLFRDYEYEEELYLSLDGRATVYVNSSMAALGALRGAPFAARPNTRVDRQAVRDFFTAPGVEVAPVRTSRRHGRPFIHVRIDADNLAQLQATKPFAWSSYQFEKNNNAIEFRQIVGAVPTQVPEGVNWTGDEAIAFRLHAPSRILDNNSGARVQRGNIVEWIQSLADRMRGVPLTIEVRMEQQSILFQTLSLFAATLVAVALLFVGLIWWIRSRAK